MAIGWKRQSRLLGSLQVKGGERPLHRWPWAVQWGYAPVAHPLTV